MHCIRFRFNYIYRLFLSVFSTMDIVRKIDFAMDNDPSVYINIFEMHLNERIVNISFYACIADDPEPRQLIHRCGRGRSRDSGVVGRSNLLKQKKLRWRGMKPC
jgi:hypothetical protein